MTIGIGQRRPAMAATVNAVNGRKNGLSLIAMPIRQAIAKSRPDTDGGDAAQHATAPAAGCRSGRRAAPAAARSRAARRAGRAARRWRRRRPDSACRRSTDRLITFGPGRNWQRPSWALNSSAVIQRCARRPACGGRRAARRRSRRGRPTKSPKKAPGGPGGFGVRGCCGQRRFRVNFPGGTRPTWHAPAGLRHAPASRRCGPASGRRPARP